MNRSPAWLLIAVFALEVGWAQPRIDFNGRLYRAVAEWGSKSSFTTDDRVALTPALRSRLDQFVRCRAAFRSGLPKPENFFASAARPHQLALERALACLLEGPGIASLATEYVRGARILYEWEGLAESPLEESDYAEAYIARNSDSPFVPYLYLFAAVRVRCAFEFYARDGDASKVASTASRYRRLLALAREADPFIRLVADDMDGAKFLAVDVGKHP
jgi:hypothetical protein